MSIFGKKRKIQDAVLKEKEQEKPVPQVEQEKPVQQFFNGPSVKVLSTEYKEPYSIGSQIRQSKYDPHYSSKTDPETGKEYKYQVEYSQVMIGTELEIVGKIKINDDTYDYYANEQNYYLSPDPGDEILSSDSVKMALLDQLEKSKITGFFFNNSQDPEALVFAIDVSDKRYAFSYNSYTKEVSDLFNHPGDFDRLEPHVQDLAYRAVDSRLKITEYYKSYSLEDLKRQERLNAFKPKRKERDER